MNRAILAEGGTVMQFVGDAVMAVLRRAGAQLTTTPTARVGRGVAMHARAAARSTSEWVAAGLPPFGLGIGVSTGAVAAALLGSEERLEYTLVGDTVNLAQRLQEFAGRRTDRAQRADVGGAHVDRPTTPSNSDEQTVKGRRRRCVGATASDR